MLETIAAGLVVALVTGVTFVAYKHPRSYRQFLKPLSVIVFAVWIGAMIYNTGFGRGFNSAIDGVYGLNKDKFVITPNFPNDSVFTLFILPVLVILYLQFLLLLPSILGLEQHKDVPDDEHKPSAQDHSHLHLR